MGYSLPCTFSLPYWYIVSMSLEVLQGKQNYNFWSLVIIFPQESQDFLKRTRLHLDIFKTWIKAIDFFVKMFDPWFVKLYFWSKVHYPTIKYYESKHFQSSDLFSLSGFLPCTSAFSFFLNSYNENLCPLPKALKVIIFPVSRCLSSHLKIGDLNVPLKRAHSSRVIFFFFFWVYPYLLHWLFFPKHICFPLKHLQQMTADYISRTLYARYRFTGLFV